MSDPDAIVFEAAAFAARRAPRPAPQGQPDARTSATRAGCASSSATSSGSTTRGCSPPPCCTTPSRTPPPTATTSSSGSARTSPAGSRLEQGYADAARRTRGGVPRRRWPRPTGRRRWCKLADLYDNLGDSRALLRGKGGKKTVAKSRVYLDAVRQGLPPEGRGRRAARGGAAGGTRSRLSTSKIILCLFRGDVPCRGAAAGE